MERVFIAGAPGERELEVIDRIERCRRDVMGHFGGGRITRWEGGLRRMTLARNVQGSNSIEGYAASLDDVMMSVDGETPLDANDATASALAGYRDAMTYVLQLARDPISVDTGLLRSLHFMMLKHDLQAGPGRWRSGVVYVRAARTGDFVYEGPDAERVTSLVDALLEEMRRSGVHPLVRAAIAHLNLVMIHPFRDGNGRMARALQTLALVEHDFGHPVFSSIEEYLGRNTPAYDEVLAIVGGGRWQPANDPAAWVRFCLVAHLRQAELGRQRFDEAERLWLACDDLAARRQLPERAIAGMWEAARGLRVHRPGYIKAVEQTAGEEIAPQTATRDLQALVRAGLLDARGETRGRHYVATTELGGVWQAIRQDRPAPRNDDPFAD